MSFAFSAASGRSWASRQSGGTEMTEAVRSAGEMVVFIGNGRQRSILSRAFRQAGSRATSERLAYEARSESDRNARLPLFALRTRIRNFSHGRTPFRMSDPTANDPAAEQPLAALAGSKSAPHVAAGSPRRVPLVLKLTLLVGLTLFFLVGVMVLANGLFWRGVLRKTVDDHISAVAASRRDMVRAQVSQSRQRVEINRDRTELRGYFFELAKGEPSKEIREVAQTTMNRMIKVKPVVGVTLVDSVGHVVLSSDAKMVGRDVSNYVSFRAGLQGT
jgi:hypothetical protein